MVLRHKKCADLMRGVSFRWCEARPKRPHNPEGNCQRCLDPFHDPVFASVWSSASVKLEHSILGRIQRQRNPPPPEQSDSRRVVYGSRPDPKPRKGYETPIATMIALLALHIVSAVIWVGGM